MSNIEGEKMMGHGAASVDIGVVRGPKGQAADRLADLQNMRLKLQNIASRQRAGEVFLTDSPEAELVNEYKFKRDDAVMFLLEQFSK